MLLSSLLRNWKRLAPEAGRRTQTSLRQRASLVSRLEVLEGRLLLSTLTVTSLQDSGAGSLRAEIAAAQSGDTIVFDATLFSSTALSSSTVLSSFAKVSGSSKHGHGKPQPPPPPPPPTITPTITLTSGELLLAKDLTIQGPGAGQLAISGGGWRAFEVAQGSAVILSGLTISGSGSAWGTDPVAFPWAGYGCGILNHGTLTMSNCTVSGVISGYSTEGGAIFSDGTLTLSDCTVSNSSAGGTATSGAGISNWGTATLTNTIISNNAAQPPFSLSYPWFNKGGGILNNGTMTLIGSRVSGNSARTAGGGIFNTGTLILNASTVTGNGSNYGGGIYNAGTMTVQNSSSITGNGGTYGADVDNVGVLNLDNTSTIGILGSVQGILDFGG